jgi:DNA-binding PadR family transcriptional regulator
MARISIFRGRDARLNKAIFWILAHQGSLTIYDIWRKLRAQRDFAYTPYNTVNRRVRALEEYDFVEKIGQRRTKTGSVAVLYQLTSRAYLAILLDKINLDYFIEKASEVKILSAMVAFLEG